MGKIPEACGLWIEQRLKEEIEETGDGVKSVKSIARMVTDEVNKVFETDINLETIRTKARRIAGESNDHPNATARNDRGKGGYNGDKSTVTDAAQVMNQEVKKGKSTREAAKVAAEKTGQKEESIRKAHQRAEKKKQTDPAPEANGQTPIVDTLSMRYAEMAIAQLEKIEKGAADSQKAFDVVTNWINKIDRKKSPWPQDCPDYFREFDRD